MRTNGGRSRDEILAEVESVRSEMDSTLSAIERKLTYDGVGRLRREMREPMGDGRLFGYDGLGRLISITRPTAAGGTPPTQTTHLFYDGVRRIQEVVTTSAEPETETLEREYIYGPDYVDEFIAQVERICRRFSSMKNGRVVGTVGAVKVEPGVINAVPGKAELAVDIRSTSAASKNRVTRLIKARARAIARDRRIGVELLTIREESPVPLDRCLLTLTREICEEKAIDFEIMPSGAGHDAMQMAKMTRSAMIFVPSKRGISHNPLEWTAANDIVLGAQLLMETMIRVASEKL